MSIAALVAIGFAAWRPIAGADQAPKPAADQVPKAVVLAKVNGQAIYNLEVDQVLATLKATAPAAEKIDASLRAAVLNQLIDRRLVETALERAHQAVTPDEIDLEIIHRKAELARLN
ncbi:MAG TPA: SurA N-terminal domain-containing protein, partial [Pirellulales bacterium]